MTSPIITINNMSFSYNQENVLDNINLNIEPGDFMAIVGPNGSGKTTLLKLILGLLKPDTGSIHIKDSIGNEAHQAIGYVPQNVHLNQDFPITALDVVMMGTFRPQDRWRRRHEKKDRQDAMTSLEKMDMGGKAHQKIGRLSGGERQRVLIARALVTRPKLLLLDEPTASIDTSGQARFFQLLTDLNTDVTILVVTHDLLVVSRYVKSVACVNRRLHYHRPNDLDRDMFNTMQACSAAELCPVGMVNAPFHPDLPEHRRSK